MFDERAEAELHCRYIAGIDLRYGAKIDELENLESRLEEIEGRLSLPRWEVRQMYMRDLAESGAIKGDANVERSAEFILLIEKKLATNDVAAVEPPQDDEALMKLLHPIISENCLPHFKSGHLRDAVLNAFIAIGDLLRKKTGLVLDGKALVEQALSIHKPFLVMSELETESRKNDQLGFMSMLSGAFTGIRNPKAHSMQHDLDNLKAAQYLVFASMLARRIDEAKRIEHT